MSAPAPNAPADPKSTDASVDGAPYPDAPTRSGFAALIGEPNAGKSTLLNQMVGQKVAIVTHKVQTTRSRIRGVTVHNGAQIVFVDTPGLFAPRRRLDRAMVAAAWGGAADADVVALLVEAHRGVTEGVERILEGLEQSAPAGGVVLVINKIDRVKRDALLALAADLNARRTFAATFFVSALTGDGTDGFMDWLAARLPEGPFLYPEDQAADLPMRQLAAEITREKLMLRLHQELPYQLTVETETWTERPDGSARVDQIIYVARENHRPMIIGKGGATLKQIGAAARIDLSEALGRAVHLFLHVKVRESWMDEAERYQQIGLDIRDS